MFMDKLDNMKNNISYFIKKNIFIVLVLIGLCPVLAISYAKFTINSESYRSNEMYISELLYSIKIDGNNVYSVEIESGETEHTIEITSLSGISTNYKLAYLNNDNLEVRYASDYMDASFGGIIMTRTISLTIKNKSNEKQTLSLMVFGGYSFNDIEEVNVLDTYTEININYLHYDYETTALYIDNTRVDELDSTKKYNLVSYTCSNNAQVTYDTNKRIINIKSDKQTKCSLYFEEYSQTLADLCQSQTLSNCLKGNYIQAGLTKVEQSATGNQNYDTTEYRYQGKNPNNYITFNGETGVWRIIGVFEVETPNRSGYTKEYKVKLLRNSNDIIEPWNLNNNNDWVNATLKITLNSGAYYNRTNAYRSIGLTSKSRSQISTTKWYLGNVGAKKDSYGTYKEERSKNVWSGNSQTWDGNVALMYPSDYMFGSSSCYNNGTDVLGHNNSTCENTNWFVTGSPWTISPYTVSSDLVIWMNDWSDVLRITVLNPDTFSAKPSVYLNANIKYTGGEGTISNPFTIE